MENNELMHYGVLGMKWGVRRARKASNKASKLFKKKNKSSLEKTKIQKKGCDFLVANDISRKDIGFSSDMNEVYILDKNLKISHIERDTKLNIAKQILEKIFE